MGYRPEERDAALDGALRPLLRTLAQSLPRARRPADGPDGTQTFWTAQHFYILTQYFAKLAVLGLYLRIFGCTPWLRRACHWCGAILTASSLGFLLYLILQCRPVAAAWDKTLPGGRCQSSDAAAFALATLSIAFDVVLVVLPVPALHRLQLHCRQRLAAAALLGLASLACVTSVLRLRYVMALNATFDPSCEYRPLAPLPAATAAPMLTKEEQGTMPPSASGP